MFWRRGNYAFNTVEGIVGYVTDMKYFMNETWFVGITANAVESLNAHRIDTDDQKSYSFGCWDIPFASAKACKVVYLYKVLDRYTVQHIDVTGFEPVKALPAIPIIVTEEFRNGQETVTKYGDEFGKDDCAGLVEQIRQKVLASQLKSLKVVHRSIIGLQFEFGEGCCTISYYGHSQEGYFQSYRSGSRSRKLVPFFEETYPEYMVCRDMDEFAAILQYFLEKDRKPGKRQNVKWVVAREDGWR